MQCTGHISKKHDGHFHFNFITKIIEVFMGDFIIRGDSFDECLHHLTLVLRRCIETNLVLNFKKCHFMVEHGVVLVHVVSAKGIKVDKAKVDVIEFLPYPQLLEKSDPF